MVAGDETPAPHGRATATARNHSRDDWIWVDRHLAMRMVRMWPIVSGVKTTDTAFLDHSTLAHTRLPSGMMITPASGDVLSLYVAAATAFARTLSQRMRAHRG